MMARGRLLGSVRPDRRGVHDHGRIIQGFVFAMFASIVAGLLVLVIVTTGVYGIVVQQGDALSQRRSSLSVVSTAVKAADTIDAVSSIEGPQGEVLVLRDPADASAPGTYETRIYLSGGYLVEEYAASEAALDPSKAVRLARTETFSFSIDDRGLLTFSTDAGACSVALRSAQTGGGA